jgi:hypothetical protein
MTRILTYFIIICLIFITHASVSAQNTKHGNKFLEYIIEGNDTIYIDKIAAARIYSKLPRQKGREWRKYYRLVYNFNKTYPYAMVAKSLVEETDRTIEEKKLKGAKRDRYIQQKQNELFAAFEKPLRNMTVSQGALLMRLIDRETGKSSYWIIRDYKNRAAAGFWQGVAKLFGSDMKKPYDPKGIDAPTEELVEIWNRGEWEEFYFSLFWDLPPKVEIPEKYLTKP